MKEVLYSQFPENTQKTPQKIVNVFSCKDFERIT